MSDTEEKTGQRPVAEFRGSGGIKVAVWKHKHDDGPDSYSIRMDRSYREESGDFKSTQYLRDQDLLRSQRLLAQADDWVEQDKSKQRGNAQSASR